MHIIIVNIVIKNLSLFLHLALSFDMNTFLNSFCTVVRFNINKVHCTIHPILVTIKRINKCKVQIEPTCF